MEILATPGGRTMDPGRLIMKINIVSDNFHFDHKAVRSNQTELFFKTPMIKWKITVFNAKKSSDYWILANFGYV